MAAGFKNISIPASLYERIEERIKGTNFSSVESFVTSVLTQLLEEGRGQEGVLSQEEEEQLRERLRSLGYLE